MKLGISSYTYTWAVGALGWAPEKPLDALRLVERTQALGLKLLQIADNLPVDALPSSRLRELKTAAKDADIEIEIGARGARPDNLIRHLRIAEFLESRLVRFIIHAPDYDPSPDEAARALAQVAADFERADVTLAIENHEKYRSDEIRQIVEATNSDHVGVCLDTVNNFGALEDPVHVVEILGPIAVNLHIKDFEIHRHSHMMGFNIVGTPAGEGRLDIPWLLRRLKDFRRDPNAILELWTPPEQTLQETIAKEAEWAERSVRNLGRLAPELVHGKD
jgi:sugar phosphate isomerase/epimerase